MVATIEREREDNNITFSFLFLPPLLILLLNFEESKLNAKGIDFVESSRRNVLLLALSVFIAYISDLFFLFFWIVKVFEMASKRILKELKDLQKDPPTSCSAGYLPTLRFDYVFVFALPDDDVDGSALVPVLISR